MLTPQMDRPSQAEEERPKNAQRVQNPDGTRQLLCNNPIPDHLGIF